jgi:hypothetical protein
MRKRRIMTAATKKAIFLVVVVLVGLASSQAAILTSTEAFAAASKSNNNRDCKDIQFRTFEQDSSVNVFSDKAITIGTPKDEYSVKIDYFQDSGTELVYYKNVAAKDQPGYVLLPGGKTITITLQTNEPISGDYYGYRIHVTLYNHKVSDCQILTGQVKDKDKMVLQIVSIEQSDESPGFAKLTGQVPAASDVDKHFTKLGVDFPFSPEAQEYYLISNGVQVR